MSTDPTISEFVVPGGTHVIKITLGYRWITVNATSPIPYCDDWQRRYTYPEFAAMLQHNPQVDNWITGCEDCGLEVDNPVNNVLCDACIDQRIRDKESMEWLGDDSEREEA